MVFVSPGAAWFVGRLRSTGSTGFICFSPVCRFTCTASCGRGRGGAFGSFAPVFGRGAGGVFVCAGRAGACVGERDAGAAAGFGAGFAGAGFCGCAGRFGGLAGFGAGRGEDEEAATLLTSRSRLQVADQGRRRF